MSYTFFNRDLSWLSFNERLLDEAERFSNPLLERVKFLSIYSSNLDEFYRVRMPALLAINNISKGGVAEDQIVAKIQASINVQQRRFGGILSSTIIPELARKDVLLLFNEELPEEIVDEITEYFFSEVAGYLLVKELYSAKKFFPENNKLYLLATIERRNGAEYYIVDIPSDHLPRFFSVTKNGKKYIVFLDDIIRYNLLHLFDTQESVSCFSFKVTRDADLDLKDEFAGNLARKIECQIEKRDFGLATRFLFQGDAPRETVGMLARQMGVTKASFVQGGVYHNMKDLLSLPLSDAAYLNEKWPRTKIDIGPKQRILDVLKNRELLLHPPYHSYEPVIRFFNEAAIDPHVSRIYVTLYRIAKNSRIASALCHAAENGKKVTVFVELKARFDEANNIKWAKRMRASGVKIIFSIPDLKVHAKIALVKRSAGAMGGGKQEYFGLLSTGNFNESTAKLYTDHVLFTSNTLLLKEIESLFRFLKKRVHPKHSQPISFQHLLVAQFNLQKRFIELIDREMNYAKRGLPASIIIKMNNLEEKVMISKLYDASRAGVNIKLIIRGICCLIPGVNNMSENITVIRIIDRYLEHGRIFLFNNNGDYDVFLGSADWMNRNMYSRIEVCFPIQNATMREEMIKILNYQLNDNQQAVHIDSHSRNIPPVARQHNDAIQSQKMIHAFITTKSSAQD